MRGLREPSLVALRVRGAAGGGQRVGVEGKAGEGPRHLRVEVLGELLRTRPRVLLEVGPLGLAHLPQPAVLEDRQHDEEDAEAGEGNRQREARRAGDVDHARSDPHSTLSTTPFRAYSLDAS